MVRMNGCLFKVLKTEGGTLVGISDEINATVEEDSMGELLKAMEEAVQLHREIALEEGISSGSAEKSE
jgi:hypothetical protein